MSSGSSSRESLSSSSALVVSEYFKDSRYLSIGDNGNFSTVHGDQHNAYYLNTVTEAQVVKKEKFIVATEEEEAEYEEFPEIKRGEFVAIRNIHRSDGEWLYDKERDEGKWVECERTVIAGDVGRIGGVASKCLVVQYSGEGAGELWKKDFRKLGGARRPENAQLVAINLSKVPMLVLTGDLVPLAHFSDRVGPTVRRYLATLAIQMDCYQDDSLWIDTSRGIFCRGPEGPRCWFKLCGGEFDLEDLPLDAELVKEDVLIRYLGSRNVNSLSRFFGGTSSELKVNQPAVISTLTDTILAVGSGVWEEWSCLGEREELANGATRFTLLHNKHDLRLRFDLREAIIDDWLAQAPNIFHAHGISMKGDMETYKLVTPSKLEGTLSSSRTKQRRRKESPPIYLFVPPLSTTTFWSFDPDGQNPITADRCHYLGLPISLEFTCAEYCWLTETYQALQAYQTARGLSFDPNTTEFAEHNQYRIFEIINQPLPSRFEEIKDLEESQDTEESEGSETTETPLSPLQFVHPEELDDASLGVVFGDVQPKYLPANTMTQSHALQKGAGYSNPAAPSSASTNFPRVETTEIDCILPRDPKSVSLSAETSPCTHSKDLKAVSAETETIIPQPLTDIILSVSLRDVQPILLQKKTTYEFVSTSPLPSINRIWFYVDFASEFSRVEYICKVGTMTTTDGKTKGKKKKTSDCTISFPIESLYRLRRPLAFSVLKQRFGMKSAPRAGTIVPVPTRLLEAIPWYIQELIWSSTQAPIPAAEAAGKKARMKRKASKVADADGGEETDVDVAWITERLRSLQLTDQNSSVIMRDPACDAMDVD